jgi:ubiquitin C-terminal hydrolase
MFILSRSIVRCVLKDLKLLICDEVSMISSLTLAFIHKRLTELTGKDDKPFGGFNILFLGDLLQLPPVKGNLPFVTLTSADASKKIGSIGGVRLWNYFEYDELTANMRQANDQQYLKIMTNLRVGVLEQEDTDVLMTRLITGSRPCTNQDVADHYLQLCADGKNPVCLFPKTDKCAAINTIFLQNLSEEIVVIHSIDRFDGCAAGTKAREAALDRLKELNMDSRNTGGLDCRLELSRKARVMLRRNMDMQNGLVNGVMGTVTDFKTDRDGVVCQVIVLFDGKEDPLPIDRVRVKFEVTKNIYVHRQQFALCLSYAITIHKSQGLSLPCAIIDCSEAFASGMVYVALSRLTSLDGLHLIAFERHGVKANTSALEEYNRLRSKHRPDLPLFRIAAQQATKRKYTHINDPTLPKPQAAPARSAARAMSTDTINGFINGGNGCYANAVLQCLYHINEFRQTVSNSTVSGPLTNAVRGLQTSRDGSSILNAINVRRCVRQDFAASVQQDAYEFMMCLLNGLFEEGCDVIRLFQHKQCEVHRCTSCHTTVNMQDNSELFFGLTFPPNPGTHISLAGLLDRWDPHPDRDCTACGIKTVQSRTKLLTVEGYLLLSFRRYQAHGKVSTLVKDFPTSGVVIDGFCFNVIGAIVHDGAGTGCGHYTCYLKKSSGSGWWYCNDHTITDRSRFVNNMKGVYILILKKVR